jgi:hypothetical protein
VVDVGWKGAQIEVVDRARGKSSVFRAALTTKFERARNRGLEDVDVHRVECIVDELRRRR